MRLRFAIQRTPAPKTMAAYRSVLKRFADLVLRGEAPEETPTHKKEKHR
jgi:hypothetical protein